MDKILHLEKKLREYREQLDKASKEKDEVCLPKDGFIDEHKKLVSVLRSKSHEDDEKEAKDQEKELKEMSKSDKDPDKVYVKESDKKKKMVDSWTEEKIREHDHAAKFIQHAENKKKMDAKNDGMNKSDFFTTIDNNGQWTLNKTYAPVKKPSRIPHPDEPSPRPKRIPHPDEPSPPTKKPRPDENISPKPKRIPFVKSAREEMIEVLEKKMYSGLGGQNCPFSNGSTIFVDHAVKGKGYHVTETLKDGSTKEHPFIHYSHLDKMTEHHKDKKLRMAGENNTEGVSLHRKGVVTIYGEADSKGRRGTKHSAKIDIIGEPHSKGDTLDKPQGKSAKKDKQ